MPEFRQRRERPRPLISTISMKRLYLVDLPGYGYAKVSASEKEKWGKMIERYLHQSKQLKAVFLLIDIRHAPSETMIR